MATDMDVDMSEDDESKGGMWALKQKIDHPMDEEAGRLINMYREKVTFCYFDSISFMSIGFQRFFPFSRMCRCCSFI